MFVWQSSINRFQVDLMLCGFFLLDLNVHACSKPIHLDSGIHCLSANKSTRSLHPNSDGRKRSTSFKMTHTDYRLFHRVSHSISITPHIFSTLSFPFTLSIYVSPPSPLSLIITPCAFCFADLCFGFFLSFLRWICRFSCASPLAPLTLFCLRALCQYPSSYNYLYYR